MKPYVQRGIAIGALMALIVGGGCKVGSDYTAPQATVNSSYMQVDEAKGVRQQVGADVSSWWSQIQDPILTQLTQEAVAGNLTLREALFRIQSARATLGATQANQYPQFSEQGGYTHGRNVNTGKNYSAFDLATYMSWEVDFFGRLARANEAAYADMEELRELYREAYVVLCADVAQAYINARSYQEQIRISEENIDIQHSTLQITQTKSEFGSASKLDESQARGICRGTESSVLTLQTLYQQQLNQISILVGRPPGHVDELLRAPAPIPSAPEQIMVGIPADLLRRRPDVRAAEQRIIAQNARVGVAIGDLYPVFTLGGSFGLEANSVGNMFDSDAIGAAVSPGFSWNILNFGKYRFNVEAKRLKQEQLVAAYRETVLEAAKEVDNALVAYVNERDRVGTLSDAVDAYTDAYELSNERYKSGQIDFQRLLDSQAGKLSYELQYVQCRASMMKSVVDLYRALGGDWAGGATVEADMAVEDSASEEQSAQAQAGLNQDVFVPVGAANAQTDQSNARYSSRDASTASYDPSAEWNERRARSRARVAEALQDENAAQDAVSVDVDNLEFSPSPKLTIAR